MLIVYDSFTGNVEKFMEKLDYANSVKVSEGLVVNEKFVMITYTTNFGEVPKATRDFLKSNHHNMVGICASGKRSWELFGTYCKSADVIHEQYGVPILLKFDMQGTDSDRAKLLERIENFE